MANKIRLDSNLCLKDFLESKRCKDLSKKNKWRNEITCSVNRSAIWICMSFIIFSLRLPLSKTSTETNKRRNEQTNERTKHLTMCFLSVPFPEVVLSNFIIDYCWSWTAVALQIHLREWMVFGFSPLKRNVLLSCIKMKSLCYKMHQLWTFCSLLLR